MTTEERFQRIEHLTAGMAEERRMDREECRRLWRDTQRQLNEAATRIGELTLKMEQTNEAIRRMGEESREADRRLGERIDALGERIDALVSGMGEFMRGKA